VLAQVLVPAGNHVHLHRLVGYLAGAAASPTRRDRRCPESGDCGRQCLLKRIMRTTCAGRVPGAYVGKPVRGSRQCSGQDPGGKQIPSGAARFLVWSPAAVEMPLNGRPALAPVIGGPAVLRNRCAA
jgi:hypothetical protein